VNPVAPPVDAVDQETAAAQQVADAHGIPFLGIRGMSDGPGDPLHLPGYPFTFFVYKQIAADNAPSSLRLLTKLVPAPDSNQARRFLGECNQPRPHQVWPLIDDEVAGVGRLERVVDGIRGSGAANDR